MDYSPQRRRESSPGHYRHHGHHRDRGDGGRMDSGRGRSRSPGRRHERGRSRSYEREDRRHHEKRYRSRSRSPGRRNQSGHGGSSGGGRGQQGPVENPEPTRCLGVFGMGLYTSETELQHVFTKYGPLEKVQVVKDAKTGRSRGFAFVYFESLEDAKQAKEQCTGLEIDGRRIRVDYSITQRPHTPTPGIYMGRPTITSGRYDRSDRSDRGYRRSPSPYYEKSSYSRSSRRGYDRSRSRSYSPRRY